MEAAEDEDEDDRATAPVTPVTPLVANAATKAPDEIAADTALFAAARALEALRALITTA